MSNEVKAGPAAEASELIKRALAAGRYILSEYDSARLIAAYGAVVVESRLCATPEEAGEWARSAGGPVVLKLCSPDEPHKKEKGFVKAGLTGGEAVAAAAREMLGRAAGIAVEGLLVQRMVGGERELLAGMKRDHSFGPCVTLGAGGIFTEALDDVSVRVAPVGEGDAREMLSGLRTARMFGAYRGLPTVDAGAVAKALAVLGEIGLNHPEVAEIDVNPLIIDGEGRPVAVDALVILSAGGCE
jgi:succinyl-CoA synthetase beta subunit